MIPAAVIAGVAWSASFAVGVGATASATGMPSGMTSVLVGSDLVLTWAAPVAGTYTITVTATKPGCPNCAYPTQLTVTAVGATCASLQAQVVQGPSAYTPATSTSWNAADQQLRLRVTAGAGKTYQLRAVGTITSLSAVLTIPASGELVTTTVVGQANAHSTTWSIEAAGADPISICGGAGSVVITGNTLVSFSVLGTANTYEIFVTSPIGAIGVPFTLKWAGPTFIPGTPAVCASSVSIVNSDLTTNTTGGGNLFVYRSDPLPLPYAAAIAFALNPLTSSLTHQFLGTACVAFTIP